MNSETRLLEILHRSMMDTEKSGIFVVKCLKVIGIYVLLENDIENDVIQLFCILQNKMIHFQEQNNTAFYCNKEYKDRTHSRKELIAEIQNQVLFNQNKMADVLTVSN